MSERKLKAWAEAGLIDQDAVDRISAWEKANEKPLGLWALIGLGALAIGLGLISVVAANWDAIPGLVRLSIHFALMLGVAAFLWWQRSRDGLGNAYFSDAMIFILGALGLTFFGHIGQYYQTSSPLWQPFLAWLLLFSPLILGYGRGWLAAGMWFAAVLFTAEQHWDWYVSSFYTGSDQFLGVEVGARNVANAENRRPFLYMGLITSIPAFVMAGAAWLRGKSSRPDFWRKLEQMGLVAILAWTSLGGLLWLVGGRGSMDYKILLIQSALLALAAAAVRFGRPTRSGTATAAIMGVAAVSNLFTDMLMREDIGGAALFMAIWGSVAWAAIHAGWRRVFQVAVGVIAIRLIILSFQLADDLLGSGVGLILTGVFTLAIAWIAVRVSKRYAPAREAEA